MTQQKKYEMDLIWYMMGYMRGKVLPPYIGKDIKGMCNCIEIEWPIGTEAINKGRDGNFDCEKNGEKPRLSF